MKLTLNGALDLSRSINSQTIWNKRSNDFFNKLALELKEDSLNALANSPSPRSQAGRGNKNTGNTRRSVFTAKLGNTNRLRMSEGFKLAGGYIIPIASSISIVWLLSKLPQDKIILFTGVLLGLSLLFFTIKLLSKK